MEKKTALLFGATGLVGHYLLQEILHDPAYQHLIVFTRKRIDVVHDKLEQVITNLTDVPLLKAKVKGDAVFCCLGTTIKKAGTQAAFRKVDFDLPVLIAQVASDNQVPTYLVVSSIGADPHSKNFYLRTKGEMETAVLKLPFKNTIIVRPSQLLGDRMEKRPVEAVAQKISVLLAPLLRGAWKKYRPVHAAKVAETLRQLSHEGKGQVIHTFFQSNS